MKWKLNYSKFHQKKVAVGCSTYFNMLQTIQSAASYGSGN